MRTKGAKNVVLFGKRTTITTSTSADVRHLSSIASNRPLDLFIGLLNHQANYLVWIEARHRKIIDLKKEVGKLKNPGAKSKSGAKEETFAKYRWYSESLVLLEAINAFEVFYKTTFTKLGQILQPFVQPDPERVLSIKASVLWGITGETLLPDLVPAITFEQDLFHDLDAVDRASDLLIGKRLYNRRLKPNSMADRVRVLRGIFQIRHTLSHNSGVVTKSDNAKFKELGLTLKEGEVVDPSKEQLSLAVFKALEEEAKKYTSWLAKETSVFLIDCIVSRKLDVPVAIKDALESLLGKDTCWGAVAWKI